ncbi:GGDEF domain-containing protein [Endozoicomonas sp. G2_1]|uniref:tetratricopeptide repeat-containing diguanylate cyclase n=1 Tax=Endozoicomonas sp. G2_1 TaxID=2821091 RepID=UPI001ADD3EAE|nr:tetratricopeptide repeat-containing diguanylate cyclase [Endozoicomonas sp. G2_1]MBO9489098.1 GGDEF domain-containing protein [Endozoicomonas sp. G2_1]
MALLFVSVPLCALEFESEQDTLLAIEKLTNDHSSSPFKNISELKDISQFSLRKGWYQAVIKANINVMNIYLDVEDFQAIASLLNETKPLTIKYVNESASIAIEVIELNLLRAEGKLDRAREIQLSLLAEAPLIEDIKLKAYVFFKLGVHQLFTEQFTDALTHFKKAYHLYLQLESDWGVQITLNAIGNYYSAVDQPEMAIQYFTDALTYIRKQQNTFDESVVLYNIANNHRKLGNGVKGIEFASTALALSQQLKDNIGVAWAQVVMAEAHLIESNFALAISLAQDAYQVLSTTKNHRVQIRSLSVIINAALALDDIELAEQTLAIRLAKRSDSEIIQEQLKLLNLQTLLAQKQKKYRDAYSYLNESISLSEQLNTAKNEKTIQRLRVELDLELKEQQNAQLKRENALNQQLLEKEIDQKRLFVTLLVLAIITLLLLFLFAFMQYKLRLKFKALSLKDPLTQSHNRRSIIEIAQNYFDEAKLGSGPFTLLMLDIDHFKNINDTYGHDVGDKVLVTFANACTRVVRNTDVFGRYGGEEWLLLLPQKTIDITEEIFNRISEELARVSIPNLPAHEKIKFSMGAVQYSAETDNNLGQLIKRADALMYQAKAQGRNCFVAEN